MVKCVRLRAVVSFRLVVIIVMLLVVVVVALVGSCCPQLFGFSCSLYGSSVLFLVAFVVLVLVVVSVDCSMSGSFLVCSLCLRCLIYARWLLVWCRWSSVCCSCVLFAGLWFFGACSFVASCLTLLLSSVLVVQFLDSSFTYSQSCFRGPPLVMLWLPVGIGAIVGVDWCSS